MKKLFIILISITLFTFSLILVLRYYQNKVESSDFIVLNLSVNDESILPTKITQTFPLFPTKTQKELESNSNLIELNIEDKILNLNYYDNVDYISPNINYKVSNKQIEFFKSGTYKIIIKLSQAKTINEYELIVHVNLKPTIIFSDLNPTQGSLVTVIIANLDSSNIVNIESELPTSSVYFKDNSETIYIPINYKTEPKIYSFNILIDDSIYDFSLNVSQSEFDSISFDIPTSVSDSTVNSTKANTEYREKVWPLYQSSIDDILWDGTLIKPVEENRISSSFGQYRYINGSDIPSRHSGIDYAADCGTPVYSTARGIVNLAENLMLSGNTIVIDHGLGLKSYYFHLEDIVIKKDEIVESNQLIGHVGTTGYSTGCHLHFQVSIKNNPLNPELLYTN